MHQLNQKSIKNIKITYNNPATSTGPEQYKDITYYRKRIINPKKWRIMMQEEEDKNKLSNFIPGATLNTMGVGTT